MRGTERTFAPVAPGAALDEAAGLYVHVPFCSAICPYCDFAVARAGAGDRSRFVAALLHEIECWRAPGVRFDTLYLGGGTPSLLAEGQLAEILGRIAERFALTDDLRLSIEVNPEDVDPAAIDVWKELGVHTVSLGVQAFDDEGLRRLGRRHRAETALRSVEQAVAAGFGVVSVDLIYGLRGVGSWQVSLERALAAGIDHLSCYELTVHEGTPFWGLSKRGGLGLATEEERASWFVETHRVLGERGWQGYEVSNFARSIEARSRHNQKYWRHVPYLGLGPSAHSFDGERRWWNVRGWPEWATRVEAGQAVAGEEALGAAELGLEVLMLGLRTADGVDLDRYRRVAGVELESESAGELAELETRGLVTRSGRRLRPSIEGMAVAESLALRLVSSA